MQERCLTSVKEILREPLAMEQEDLQDPERLPGDMLSVARKLQPAACAGGRQIFAAAMT